jgi:hypothetical protein
MAESEQARFRAALIGEPIKLRSTDCAKENGAGG